MNIECHFDHFNINVTDLEKSRKFYKEALNLDPVGRIESPDGNFIIEYLKAPGGEFRLELTWLRDHPQAYELGENESHIALRLDRNDFEQVKEYHRQLGVICFENPVMGIYFIHDPDDYWIEILPAK